MKRLDVGCDLGMRLLEKLEESLHPDGAGMLGGELDLPEEVHSTAREESFADESALAQSLPREVVVRIRASDGIDNRVDELLGEGGDGGWRHPRFGV